jgi:L-aspartate oxidase
VSDPGSMTSLDLLVIGSGVAGLTAAVRAASRAGMRVGVLTKSDLEQAATRWAQGGVAAVLGGDPDSTDLHLADTLSAGAGLCDVDAVRVLVDEGPRRVTDLISMGAMFDRDPDGGLQLAREGGHSQPRIVHAGGAATGAEIERALVVAVERTAAAIFERWFALDLLVRDGRCVGVRALASDGTLRDVGAANVLLATGGCGQVFHATTNPHESTGDGLAMALRAGVVCADVEFMQFHPTALAVPKMPKPLLTEALRGHGALLRDPRGMRFVDELLPRDVVSRAETAVMAEHGVDHVWLDATGLVDFAARFPTLAMELSAVGLDPAHDLLPVAPAAHYHCGGIVTDLDGATTMPGLWAAGEVACTGVHGANRLASNSLLEGMVFGPRVIEAIASQLDGPRASGAMRGVLEAEALDHGVIGGRRVRLGRAAPSAGVEDEANPDPAVLRDRLQRSMTLNAGVLRDEKSLSEARAVAVNIEHMLRDPSSAGAIEARNLASVAAGIAGTALARTESRGCHTRSDRPDTDPNFRVRLVLG